MRIKDLIAKLEALYNTYDDEYKSIAGEPEIMIDVFSLKHPHSLQSDNPCFDRKYAGFSNNIVISKSSDGVYDILSAFDEDYPKDQKAKEPTCGSLPGPQGWET